MTMPIDRLREALGGRYLVERELGSGGMATVYLATDLRHDRPVAVKVLRPELSAAVGPERFQREIQVTANLHHPHIVQLFDSGEAAGALYYVMPYIEGETLRERIDRGGPLPIEEAVAVSAAVARALEYAHARGVVHRDVKPENILLQGDVALVADFGIAHAVEGGAEERLTRTGASMGTPSYMSPEQATGEGEPDRRSDVYSLGCVTYEMLTGEPPFSGSSQRMVIAKILGEKPVSPRAIRDTVPPHLEAAVSRAMAKAPADRFARAGDFADALEGKGGAAGAAVPGEAARGGGALSRIPAATWAVAGAAALGLSGWMLLGGPGGTPADPGAGTTIRPVTNFVGWEHAPNFSPDGSMITYSHIVGGSADVATIPVGGGDPHILTEGSPYDEWNPTWSPDGSRIAFASDRGSGTDLYWISPTGGAEHKITETRIPFLERMGDWAGVVGTGPWSPDGGELLFSRLEEDGDVALWSIDLASREENRLTTPPPGASDLFGSFSRDGERIVYTRNAEGVQTMWLAGRDGEDPRPLLEDEPFWGPGSWLPGDRRIVYSSMRGGAFNLWAVDVETGEKRQLTSGGGRDWWPAAGPDGSIAYTQFGHQIDLYWADLDEPGADHERLTTFTGDNFGARVSPDGGRILYYSNRSGSHDLWVLDRETGQHRRLTDDPAGDRLADWSADGTEVVFMSDRGGTVHLWILDAETGATRRLVDQQLPWTLHRAEAQGGPRWAPDGSVIGYLAPAEDEQALWTVRPDGSEARPTAVRGARSFAWYLDGQRVLYTRRAPGDSGGVELRAAHFGTGEDRLLRSGALAEISVSADGRVLTYISAVSHFTMEMYRVPLAPAEGPDRLPTVGGEPVRITFGEGVWHAHSGGIAPDGSGVVYSRDRDFGDIYLIVADAPEGGEG